MKVQFENDHIKVFTQYPAKVWNKYGKVRIYFADRRNAPVNHVDLTDLANGNLGADVNQAPAGYASGGEYDHDAHQWHQWTCSRDGEQIVRVEVK